MTCIIGAIAGGKIWMGGDSCAGDVSNYHVALSALPKVFRLSDLLIGYTTSFRLGDLLRYSFCPKLRPIEYRLVEKNLGVAPLPLEAVDGHEWMVREFVPRLVDTLAVNGFLHTKDGVQSIDGGGGSILVGLFDANGPRLLTVENDLAVLDYGKIAAIGCGAVAASAALAALLIGMWKAEVAVNTSLKIASGMNAYVREPFTTLCLEPPAS